MTNNRNIRRSAWPLAALATLMMFAPALAAEPKPDFNLKTKSVEASVELDAKIKADPALAADCLNEGKAWAEGYRTEAEGDQIGRAQRLNSSHRP